MTGFTEVTHKVDLHLAGCAVCRSRTEMGRELRASIRSASDIEPAFETFISLLCPTGAGLARSMVEALLAHMTAN